MKVNRRLINSESDLIKTLEDLYFMSKEGKNFFSIMEILSNEEVIKTAIHNIKSNKGSKTAGIDGKTIDDFLQMETSSLVELIRNTINSYTPQPVKRIYIPKGNIKSSKKSEMRP
ncbi:RNA-dependent DNA polymerase, partial [Bacillus wiedmannii]